MKASMFIKRMMIYNIVLCNAGRIKENTPVRRLSGNGQSGALSVDQQRKYNELVMKAKRLATDGMIKEALECNKKALKICFSDKLEKRIQKMEVN